MLIEMVRNLKESDVSPKKVMDFVIASVSLHTTKYSAYYFLFSYQINFLFI